MRTSILLIMTAFILASCGQSESTDLDVLTTKRDSLQKVRETVTKEIASLEEQIASMDTTRRVRITNVTSLALNPVRFEHFFKVQGVVETDRNAQLFPEAAGRVVSILVSEGDKVTKGQTLITLDGKIVQSQIDELESRLALAKTVFEKQKSLWDKNVGSEIQYLEAKNNYESLKESLETLQTQRAMYTIVAPFSGIVDEINPKVGEMAGPQFPAVRLVNTEDMYIKSDVTERYLGQVSAGDSVEVFFPGVEVHAKSTIQRIGQFINPNNRTFKIRVAVPNTKGQLRPNTLGELMIRDYVSDSATVVPSSLIQLTPTGEEFVYVLEDNKAKKVAVTTGMSYKNQVEVVDGLPANAILINKGARSIKDGDTVNVIQ